MLKKKFSQLIFYLTLALKIQIRFYFHNTLTGNIAPQLYEKSMKDKYGSYMGENKKFPKSGTLENQNLELVVCLQNITVSKLNG